MNKRKRKRTPEWLQNATRRPIDIHVHHRNYIIGLIHPRAHDVAPLRTRITVFTGRMLKKNCQEHPEMQGLYAALPELVRRPSHIARDSGSVKTADSQVAILYGEVAGELFRVVVHISVDAEKWANSVFSYRKCGYSELFNAAQKRYIVYESPEAG